MNLYFELLKMPIFCVEDVNVFYKNVESARSAIKRMMKEKMEYLKEPRARQELQAFCNYGSRDYFRTKVLNPLVEEGIIDLTIPEKPHNLKQRYVKHTS